MGKKLTRAEEIAQTDQYLAFLKKRLESENYKKAVTKEEYAKEKAKYDKAKFRRKILGNDS